MGNRIVRTGKTTHIGWHPHYRYEGELGNVYTGIDHQVQILTTVQDGPDKGREIQETMSPEEARSYARLIMTAADDAEARERSYQGLGDTEDFGDHSEYDRP